MKIILFLSIFISTLLCCDPFNVYTNLFPNKVNNNQYINKGIRIGFISKTRCKDLIIQLKGEDDQEFFYDKKLVAQLVSITVSKFVFDDTYQIFYSYQALIQMDLLKQLNFTNFKYKFLYNKQKLNFKDQKEFQFKSKFNYSESSKFKIAVIGNLKIDYINQFIKIWKEREIDCLIHLGNFQEDWYKNGGEQFNHYFNLLEPLISQIPFYFVKGSYEKPGDFNGPLNNRFLQTFSSNQIDNYFSSVQVGKLNFNFYNLQILKSIPQRYIIMNYIQNELNQILQDQTNKIAIFSNYSINCIDKNKFEVCSDNNPFAIRQFELFLSQIRTSLLVSSGYPVYQYFKIQTFQSKYHYLSNYWDSQIYNPMNYLVGTGGYSKFVNEDFDMSYKDEKMNITNLANELGYLEMNFDNLSFEQFSSSFISIQKNGDIIEKDVNDSKGMKKSLAETLKKQYQQKAQQREEQYEELSNEEELTSNSRDESSKEALNIIKEQLKKNQEQKHSPNEAEKNKIKI